MKKYFIEAIVGLIFGIVILLANVFTTPDLPVIVLSSMMIFCGAAELILLCLDKKRQKKFENSDK